jgi:hypothetical protein
MSCCMGVEGHKLHLFQMIVSVQGMFSFAAGAG